MAHAGGRPTDYRPEYCQLAIDYLDEGRSKAELARYLRIARSTLDEWAKNHSEFSEAINRAVEYSEAVWIEIGRENLGNKNFNSRLYELNMKNRFGWSDKKEIKQESTMKVSLSKESQEVLDLLNEHSEEV